LSIEPLLKMNSIVKSFDGIRVLNNVSLNVKRGTAHALMGENGAGKSTLMNILCGIHQKDSGEIHINGKLVNVVSPKQAQTLGISMIHQELSTLPDLSVAANVFIGREPVNRFFSVIDKKQLREKAKAIFDKIGISINPDKNVRELSVAEEQLVEIAKAISYNSDIIVMDEPTSAITELEVEKLFAVIETLKKEGKAIIYISHKIDEIFRIADEITVMRDGELVGTGPSATFNPNLLISMMVGRELNQKFAKKDTAIGDVVFEVKSLSRKGKFQDISFNVKKGEILGIAGLMGSGRTEIVETIFGVERADHGEVFIDGEKVVIHSPKEAIKHGIAFVSEDRKHIGLNLVASVKENITMANLKEYCVGGQVIRKRKECKVSAEYVKMLRIKTAPSLDQKVNYLSGGNQQKVVLARWMSCKPRVLIMDEPTRGIDVGAKAEIYKLMCEFVAAGNAVIMISSELPEIMGMSDRTLVLHQGKVTGEFMKEEITQEAVMACASGLVERRLADGNR
jgi:inositol transport system ATP-binding protein